MESFWSWQLFFEKQDAEEVALSWRQWQEAIRNDQHYGENSGNIFLSGLYGDAAFHVLFILKNDAI